MKTIGMIIRAARAVRRLTENETTVLNVPVSHAAMPIAFYWAALSDKPYANTHGIFAQTPPVNGVHTPSAVVKRYRVVSNSRF